MQDKEGMMRCWKCGHKIESVGDKVCFKAECEYCHAWLHTCRNCLYYKPGAPNDCVIPDTEYVPDREAANYCEDFSLLGKAVEKTIGPGDVAKRLFGE